MSATPDLKPIQARMYTDLRYNSPTELARIVASYCRWKTAYDDRIYDQNGVVIASWIENVADAMMELGLFSQENGGLTGIHWSKIQADDGQTLAVRVRDCVRSRF